MTPERIVFVSRGITVSKSYFKILDACRTTWSTVYIDDLQISGATAQNSVAPGRTGRPKFVYPWIQLHLHTEMFGSRPEKVQFYKTWLRIIWHKFIQFFEGKYCCLLPGIKRDEGCRVLKNISKFLHPFTLKMDVAVSFNFFGKFIPDYTASHIT